MAIICAILAIAVVWLIIDNNGAKKAEKAADYYGRLSEEIKALAGIKGNINDIHIHTDFKVVVDGEAISFRRQELDERNAFAHMHLHDPEDGDKVLHIEGRGITLGHFFNTLGMKLTSSCLTVGNEERCTEHGKEGKEGKELMLFVNGKRNYELDNYEPENRDRILIIYGSYT
ncbi:hypothetical protein HYU15_02045, partial [Candidatus Woesearchaeota archaeon]|nr:hypothetical protein [Candidatus Woesearchaeota archaeon]